MGVTNILYYFINRFRKIKIKSIKEMEKYLLAHKLNRWLIFTEAAGIQLVYVKMNLFFKVWVNKRII